MCVRVPPVYSNEPATSFCQWVVLPKWRCSLKRETGNYFFFSPLPSHSAEAPARCEMTAVIKLIESERRALLSPWDPAHPHTMLVPKRPRAFAANDGAEAENSGLTRPRCGDWIRFVSTRRGVWHLNVITAPWCVCALVSPQRRAFDSQTWLSSIRPLCSEAASIFILFVDSCFFFPFFFSSPKSNHGKQRVKQVHPSALLLFVVPQHFGAAGLNRGDAC